MQGINIIGVQFRRAGKIYDFSSGTLELKVGDKVIVDSEKGQSVATVASVRFHNPVQKLNYKLQPILRKMTIKEINNPAQFTPDHATEFAKNKVLGLKLNMRVLKSEVQFGGSKIVIYFIAPGRVDFRELVKELASGLRSRVELKQVGARDETKLLGGVGICGREYCCSSFLREFIPVSIKMAKNQNLALNPNKVSGGCGRLLCCLTYENSTYTHLRKMVPPKGTKVKITSDQILGIVIKGDILNQALLVQVEGEVEARTVKISEVEILERAHSENTHDADDSEGWEDDSKLDSFQ